MKRILLIILFTTLPGTGAFAETIYLKDGSLVKGTIKVEDEKSVLVEFSDTWRRIDKSAIEHIDRSDRLLPGSIQSIPPAEPGKGEQPAKEAPAPASGLQQPQPVEKPATPAIQPQQPVSGFLNKNMDLRLKIGNAAGVDRLEFIQSGLHNDTGSRRSGKGFQLELAVSPLQHKFVGPVFSAGVFRRRHSGQIDDPVQPTTIDYDAFGVALAAGIRLKPSEQFHFEAKFEIGAGRGEVTLDSPRAWNAVKQDTYSSAGLILGWYYAFSKPGFVAGIEVGVQSFTGNFIIWNNEGHWDEAKVTGGSGIVNMALGYRF